MTSDDLPDERASGISLPILVLLLIVLLTLFASRFVLVPLAALRLGLPFLLACAEAAAIAGTGALAMKLFERRGGAVAPLATSLAFDFAIGYPLAGALFFLVGLLTTTEWVLAALLVLLIVPAALYLRPSLAASDPADESRTSIPTVVLLSLCALIALLTAQIPASTLDELAYHLAVPNIWLHEGRVVSLPLLSHSWFPMGIESADLPLLAILGTDDGAIASHFLHLFSALGALSMIFSYTRRRAGREAASLATVAVAATPALLLTSGWSWNEWPLLAITIALLASIDALVRTDEGGESARAVALSLAAGFLTKYTFLLIAPPILLAAAIELRRRGKSARALLAISVAGGAIGSIFFIRNLFAAGNPVAPFFEPLAPAVSGFRRTGTIAESLLGYLFDGRLVDESLGISLVILTIALWLAWGVRRAEPFLFHAGALSTIVAAGLALMFPSSRILLPPLAVAAIAGCVMVASAGGRKAWITSFRYLLLLACFLQIFLAGWFVSTLEPFALLGGRMTDEQYLKEHRGSYEQIRWADERLPAGSRTLVVGVNELFWFSGRVRGGGNFDAGRIDHYLAEGSPGDVRSRLRSDGVSHLAVFTSGIHPSGGRRDPRVRERETALTSEARANLAAMTSTARLVDARDGVALYDLQK